jgi:hypothetical protein
MNGQDSTTHTHRRHSVGYIDGLPQDNPNAFLYPDAASFQEFQQHERHVLQAFENAGDLSYPRILVYNMTMFPVALNQHVLRTDSDNCWIPMTKKIRYS